MSSIIPLANVGGSGVGDLAGSRQGKGAEEGQPFDRRIGVASCEQNLPLFVHGEIVTLAAIAGIVADIAQRIDLSDVLFEAESCDALDRFEIVGDRLRRQLPVFNLSSRQSRPSWKVTSATLSWPSHAAKAAHFVVASWIAFGPLFLSFAHLAIIMGKVMIVGSATGVVGSIGCRSAFLTQRFTLVVPVISIEVGSLGSRSP